MSTSSSRPFLPESLRRVLGIRAARGTGLDPDDLKATPRAQAASALGLLIVAACGGAIGGETFVDVTDRAGIRFLHVNGAIGEKHLYETMIGGAGWLDFDGDGLLDLYLVQGHGESRKAFSKGKEKDVLYRNRGDGTFEDVTERARVGDTGYGSGLAVGDVDNDGDTDLYVTNVGPNTLYLNNGDGTFQDATAESGLTAPLWSSSAAFADVNNDGLLDLYVASYLYYDPNVHKACTGNAKKIPGYCHPNKFDGAPDYLFLNLGNHRFRDISKEAGVAISGRILAKGLGVLPTDFDRDGRIDFFIANDSVPNFLWRNLGSGKFEDAALETGVALNTNGLPTAAMGIDGGDVNGDGHMDYMVTNFSEESDSLFLGEGNGFFTESSIRAGLAEVSFIPLSFGMKFFDFDLDGDLDIYIATGHILDNVEILHPGTQLRYGQPDQLFENDGKGHFTEIGASSGACFRDALVGRAAAFADYDGDGDIDVYVANVGQRGALLENRQSTGNHWVGLQLRGTPPSSRDAYGSYVEVKVAGKEIPIPIEIRTAGSYLASNDHRQVIGLGKDGQVEWTRVRWPDGLIEVFKGLRRDAYNLLVRGQGTAP